MKILIVDDDPVLTLELKQAVALLGKAYIASSGQSAVAIAKDIIPDIVLLDIGLPDVGGFDVLKEIHHNPTLSAVNVIMITSDDSFETHLKSLSEGATDFIVKPINTQLLQNKIKNLLYLSQTLKARVIRQTDTSIKSLEIRFKNLLGMLDEAVLITDQKGIIQITNQYCAQLFGHKAEDMVGQTLRTIIPDVGHELNLPYNSERLGVPRETIALTKAGRVVSVEVNLSHYEEPTGGHYLALLRDLSERKQIKARLLKAALYDSLTGAFSREALDLDAEKCQSQLMGQNFFACLLDIDRFHELNAIFGHVRCNDILRSLAINLRRLLHDMPVRIYRVSGDVFVLKSNRSMTEQEYAVYESLLSESVMTLKEQIGKEINHKISISAVASIFDVDILKNGAMIPMLEDALRLNKKAGHTGELTFVTHSNYGRTVQIAELSQALMNSVDRTRLDVVFQPKVTAKGTIRSVEALLRWNDDFFYPLGLVDYIEVAESTGAIVEVGYFVIEKVCKAINEIHQSGHEIDFSINLSLRQFSDTSLISRIVEICRRHKVDTKTITFEVTETVVAENIRALTYALSLLKDQGFSVSIDDFGTGQSNLRYINKLPLDEIKIDKSFIDDIESVACTYPVVDTIINMAKAMNLRLVAEGVETQVQAEYLAARDCDLIQGYYFFKPLPLTKLLESLDGMTAFSH